MSGVRMLAALVERLMEIHTKPPILYYGFNDCRRNLDQSEALNLSLTLRVFKREQHS